MIKLTDICFDYVSQPANKVPPLETDTTTTRALNQVHLAIKRGEFVAIVGASGSGKSTLMNILGLMTLPSSGDFAWDERNICDLGEAELAQMRNEKIGFIFQNFFLLPRLSVAENILLPFTYAHGSRTQHQKRTMHQTAEQRLEFLAHEFGIHDQLEKLPSELSGGQKQRVAICRALILEPDLILADEPTGALDSENTHKVLQILQQLNKQGKTVVVVTHDQAVAKHAARIVTLRDGKICSDETQASEGLEHIPAHTRLETQFQEIDQDSLNQNKAKAPFLNARQRLRSILSAVSHSISDLKSNPVRAVFTLFGLAIGVSSIIIMITLTSEARNSFRKFFDTKGGRNGFVSFDSRTADRLGTPRWSGLDVQTELPKVSNFFSRHGRVTAELAADGCKFTSAYRPGGGSVNGIDSVNQFYQQDMKLNKGRFFMPHELTEKAPFKVTILGSQAAETLFPIINTGAATNPLYPIGERVVVKGCQIEVSLEVVGVLQEQDSLFDNAINSSIWTPSSQLMQSGLPRKSRRFTIIPHEGVNPTWLSESFRNYLRMRTEDRFPFRMFVAEEHVSKVNMMLTMLGGLTVIIGGLCTVIGGIGVMNIMLVNIAERIREIGIRKALGAKDAQIRNQFLFESLLLCTVAGIGGIVAGTLVCNAAISVVATHFPKQVEAEFVWNTQATLIALISSVAAGLGFGLMPARRAAALSVVEALQRE